MWEIGSAKIGTDKLGMYLKDGWEPFCITPDYDAGGAMVVWLKKYYN